MTKETHMKEEVQIALNGIKRFSKANPEIEKFVDLLDDIIVDRDRDTIRLATIFCTHDNMQRFLPMFLNTNEQKWLITQYEFLQQMEMSINGAGKLQLVGITAESVDEEGIIRLQRTFLLKDGKDENELIDYIRNDMLAMGDEHLAEVNIKNLTWGDMILIEETIKNKSRLEPLLFYRKLEEKLVDNVRVVIWK